MIDANRAMQQAWMTAHDYALHAVYDLCEILDINRSKPGWREKLAPFAPVLAAMITAAATDNDTTGRSGVVVGTLAQAQMHRLGNGE